MLTDLLDRQSFPDVLEREILRARLAHYPLALLVIDVDRLTWLNARIGILAADGVLLELAKRLRSVTHRLDYAFRLGGGRFAVVRPGSEGGRRVGAVRGDPGRSSRRNPIGDAGVGLRLGRHRRARAARRRRLVRRAGRGGARRGEARRAADRSSSRARPRSRPKANGTLHEIAPGEIVLEG